MKVRVLRNGRLSVEDRDKNRLAVVDPNLLQIVWAAEGVDRGGVIRVCRDYKA